MSWYEVETERVGFWEHDYAIPTYSVDPRIVQVYVVYENRAQTFDKREQAFGNEEVIYEEIYPSTSTAFDQEVALELDVCDYEEEACTSEYRWYNERYEETVKVDDEDYPLDSPPILEPQVSQIVRNTELCRLCAQNIPTGCRRMHIRRFHLQRKLFRCPHCKFSSNYSYGNVRAHMWQMHYSRLKPITVKNSLNDVMMDYAYMCFGDQRLLARYEKEVVDTVMDLIDWAADGVKPEDLIPVAQQTRQGSSQNAVWAEIGDDGLPFDIIDPGEEQEMGNSSEKSTQRIESLQITQEPAAKRSKRPTSTCLLCGLREITHRERHVLQHHFKRLVYLCPHCSFGSTYAPNVIKDHMRTKHIALGGNPVDIRGQVTKAIDSIYEKCFGPISYIDSQ
ncbi:unnamed protein product, partial [Mesorhabditis belari]|uniref:C2H2-type domain-containing protein n=1 Tax=Mesorhabditis belari TaxID=2138241 RepID=A0AAF3FH97_9BILA